MNEADRPAEPAGPGSEINTTALAPADDVRSPGDTTGAAGETAPSSPDCIASSADPAASWLDSTRSSPEVADVSSAEEVETNPPTTMDLRARLLGQFERWLDRMLEDEPAVQGLPEELLTQLQGELNESSSTEPGTTVARRDDCDLYQLFSALTGLTGEIRLQGRAFKQLADALAPLGEIPQRLDALQSAQVFVAQQVQQFDQALVVSNQREQAGESALPPARQVLDVIFDLQERLERGLRALDTPPAPPSTGGWKWFGRRQQQPNTATDALRQGYQLTLSRLDAAMQQWGIQRIAQRGEPFDPSRMTAVDVEKTADAPEGTVLEVYRSGYALHDSVLATAQVKVARKSET